MLEALSATGLRSIRYANEIPLIKYVPTIIPLSPPLTQISLCRYVIANDLDPAAAVAMRRNVELNGLGPTKEATAPAEEARTNSVPATVPQPPVVATGNLGKVRVNEGDAW